MEEGHIRGLTPKEAEEHLARYGKNRLTGQKKRSLFRLFLAQFQDWMIGILLAAAGLSFVLGEKAEACTVLALLLLNALLGFFQEARTEKTVEALKKLGAPRAAVRRGGKVQEIDPELLTVGDLLILEAGDRIGADGVLLSASSAETDESLLTGESRGEEKKALPPGKDFPKNEIGSPYRVYMGTVLTSGHCLCRVTDVGMQTQMGKIAHLLSHVKEEKTPLQKNLSRLGKKLGILCLSVCALVALFGLIRGEAPLSMLITGISLAVAAVPEGLPAVVTLSLALATGRMLKKNALLRRLHLVETLGSATVICSDKTGTLTEGRMEVQALLSAEGCLSNPEDFSQKDPALMTCLALCNRLFWEQDAKGAGPTEAALHRAAAGFSSSARLLKELPFDSSRKRMSVLIRDSKGTLQLTKGAYDLLLPLCSAYRAKGGLLPLDAKTRRAFLLAAGKLAQKGLRVLAFAEKRTADLQEEGLTFLGFAGLADPPRKETKAAVAACRRAGIRPCMVTGDAKETALAVAKAIGLSKGGAVLEGRDLDRMDDLQLRQAVQKTDLFARVTPAHKLRIVRAFRQNGQVVAMTGDGVNDAPAVKEADIGIAMGKGGTDVTREAAGMVLLDDRFSSIVEAISEGRAIFDNIRRFIRYLLACNLGEVLCMFLAMVFGMPTLLLPIQILLVNFVTDGLPALALGAEPPEKGIMERPPKNSLALFSGGLWQKIILRGVLIGLSTLLGFSTVYALSGGQVESARTGALFVLIFTQLIHAFECKSETLPLFSIPLFNNKKLLAALLFSLVLLFAVLYLPGLSAVFAAVPLPPNALLACLGISFSVPVCSSLFTLFSRKFR